MFDLVWVGEDVFRAILSHICREMACTVRSRTWDFDLSAGGKWCQPAVQVITVAVQV